MPNYFDPVMTVAGNLGCPTSLLYQNIGILLIWCLKQLAVITKIDLIKKLKLMLLSFQQ